MKTVILDMPNILLPTCFPPLFLEGMPKGALEEMQRHIVDIAIVGGRA